MTDHHGALKHMGDIGATISSAFVVSSHFAQLATPILTFLIALATLGWWALRYVERWQARRAER